MDENENTFQGRKKIRPVKFAVPLIRTGSTQEHNVEETVAPSTSMWERRRRLEVATGGTGGNSNAEYRLAFAVMPKSGTQWHGIQDFDCYGVI
jgi:hypothetical protein